MSDCYQLAGTHPDLSRVQSAKTNNPIQINCDTHPVFQYLSQIESMLQVKMSCFSYPFPPPPPRYSTLNVRGVDCLTSFVWINIEGRGRGRKEEGQGPRAKERNSHSCAGASKHDLTRGGYHLSEMVGRLTPKLTLL